MAQPITDYTSFFIGAKQSIQELEELKQKEKMLLDLEKQLENSLKTLDLIERIMSDNRFKERQKKNFPNAVRCYYEYVNGSILGTLKENNRR